MQSISDIYELMPEGGHRDCGECGLSTCRAFARRLAKKELEVDRCPYLKADTKKRIKKLQREGIQLVKQVSFEGQEGVALIHPCVTDAKKVSAETQLAKPMKYGFLDVEAFKPLADLKFKDVRCSSRLGILKFNHGLREIVLYSSGKINVKKASDREDAIRTIDRLGRMMWPATICTACGSVAMECAAVGCAPCQHKVCPVLRGGAPKTDLKPHKARETKVRDVIDGKDVKPLLSKVKTFARHILAGKTDKAEKAYKGLLKASVDYLLEIDEEPKASLGIVFMGIAEAMDRVQPLNQKLALLFETAVQAILENDRQKAYRTLKACKAIRKSLRQKDLKSLNQIERLADVLDLPMPA